MPQINCSRRNACENAHLISSCSMFLDRAWDRVLWGWSEDSAALISQAPDYEIFCSREARVQVAFFIQWSTLFYRTSLWIILSFGCFALILNTEGRTVQTEVTQLKLCVIHGSFLHKIVAVILHTKCYTLLKATVLAPWLHRTLQLFGFRDPHKKACFFTFLSHFLAQFTSQRWYWNEGFSC